MFNEDLLATYSLLSYIRESIGEEKRKSLAYVFVPLVKEGLAGVVAKHGNTRVMGKDYTEIKDHIYSVFQLEIPIPVLATVLPIISDEAGDLFRLHRDHSFIISPGIATTIMGDYIKQKERIARLEENYNSFCLGEGVTADFGGVIAFIQDQKQRIFDQVSSPVLESQHYHISKYIGLLIKKKNEYYDTICDLYLGGIISSYLKFQVKNRIVDADLLIDTNFYVSLVNLNTEESYATCKQLYDMTITMGFRYKILETTISQIRILLSNRVAEYGNKDFVSAIDQADILAACERRGLSVSDLQAYKDELLGDLSKKGITPIYKSNIPNLVENVKRSKELKTLKSIRGNYDSAFNDLLAQEYVDYKRTGQAISEFCDVNCWFLTNSYSSNKSEINDPIWKRRYINASDLLVLLWYANPSLNLGSEKSMLAMTSLSANVLRYRAEKRPKERVVKEITKKVAILRQSGYITENSLAKLCIRMSEGCIDNTEAERLVTLPTKDFVEYVNKIQSVEGNYADVLEENTELKKIISEQADGFIDVKVRAQIESRRAWSIVYVVLVFALYFVSRLGIEKIEVAFWKHSLQALYWILTTVVMNWFSHSFFIDGLRSFWNYKKVYDKLKQKYEKGPKNR